MKHKPIIAGVLLVIVLLAAAGGVFAVKRWQIRKGEKPPMPHISTVDVASVEKTTWTETARLVGTVVAKRSVTVANEVEGVVKEVAFESGDEVQAGQVLLTLDTATEQADLAAAKAAQEVSVRAVEVAQADIRVAQSNLDLARSNQERYSTASGAVSASEVDRVNADLRKATADIERAQSAMAKAQAEVDQAAARAAQIQIIIDKKTIRAPFHARASMRTVHPGQYLAEGTSIVMLAEITDDIYLDFAVPQEYAVRVVPGMVVTARSDVLGSEEVKITVVSMDAMVNPATRNIRVRSSVADPEHRLKQGMFIDVEVPIELPREYAVIPTTAVRRAAFGDHVFVVEPNPGPAMEGMPPLSVAKQRMVELGPDIGGRVLVKSGLKPGEQVATNGSFKLREGALVMKGMPAGGAGGAEKPGGAAGEKPVASK